MPTKAKYIFNFLVSTDYLSNQVLFTVVFFETASKEIIFKKVQKVYSKIKYIFNADIA